MDMDFWAARLQRRIPAASSARGRNNSDEHSNGVVDGGEEVRAWFPCPFCYTEIEMLSFCAHLQEEHCFDLKNAVCPICAANLGRDALGHFTVQHAHSIKRRKASYKSGLWSNMSAYIVKDLKEISSFPGVDSRASDGQATTPDPLLSPFLSVVPKETPQDRGLLHTAASQSIRSSQTEVEEVDAEEKGNRAAFLHELLFSAIFST